MVGTLESASAQELSKEVIKSHLHLGHSAAKWFEWLVDDCLAGMGKRLDDPWSDDQTEKLFYLGQLYGKAVQEAPNTDLLGHVYQDLATNYGRKHLGQFFTPKSIAKLMAKMTYANGAFENKEVVRLSEPTLGDGGMVMAFIECVIEDDPAFMNKLSITGVDIDVLCVKMGTLQILANNLIHSQGLGELRTYHGDTLGNPADLKPFLHASTPTFDQLAVKQQKQGTLEAKNNPPQPQLLPKGQLDMFE